jgi:signal peptidase II
MSDLDTARATDPSRVPGTAPAVEARESEPIPQSPHERYSPTEAFTPRERDAGKAEPRTYSSHWQSFVVIAALVVVLDQVTKRFIDRNLPLGDSWPSEDWPVRFMHVKNTGAAFSMLQNQTLFLTVMSVVGLGAILLYFRYRPSDHPLLRIALALQLGGAIGNLIDRARYGEVTDFIKFPYWPVFNVADSAISVGVTAVVLFLLFAGDGKPRPAEP